MLYPLKSWFVKEWKQLEAFSAFEVRSVERFSGAIGSLKRGRGLVFVSYGVPSRDLHVDLQFNVHHSSETLLDDSSQGFLNHT